MEAVELPANLEMETVGQTLARKAAALRADTRWAPGGTDIRRGRAVLLEAFEQPHNLPLPKFAKLALQHVSRTALPAPTRSATRTTPTPPTPSGPCARPRPTSSGG
ncbi:hypothetical protein GCM10025795_07340 [Verticiella sediminum]